MKRDTRNARFTLVELLVVVAIVVILLALLLPSLQSARARVKATQCMTSMRTVTQIFNLYTNDWEGWAPPLGDFQTQKHEVEISLWFGNYYGTKKWTAKMAKNLCPDIGENTRGSEYYGTLGGGTRWLRLPWQTYFGIAQIEWRSNNWTSNWYGWNTYSFESARSDTIPWSPSNGDPLLAAPTPNIHFSGRSRTVSVTYKMMDTDTLKNVTLRSPSESPAFADLASWNGLHGYWGRRAPHYRLGCNVAFVDGHVKFTPYGKFQDSVRNRNYFGNGSSVLNRMVQNTETGGSPLGAFW